MVLQSIRNSGLSTVSLVERPQQSIDSLRLREQEEDDDKLLSPYDIWPSRNFLPLFVLVTGRRGMGKGLMLQALAHIMKLRYERWGSDFTIFSNYKNTLADIEDPDLALHMMHFADEINKALILLDELTTVVSTFESQTLNTKSFVDWIMQMRKCDAEVVAATQFAGQIPTSVLRQIDLILNMKLIGDGYGVRVHIWDVHGQFFPWAENRIPQLPGPNDYDLKRLIFGTKNLFPTYNTKEKIPPLRSPSEFRAKLLRAQGHKVKVEQEED